MNLKLVQAYCEYVSRAASDAGWKLILSPHGFMWKQDQKQLQHMYVTNDSCDSLHMACMIIDNEILKLAPLEIK